MEYTGEGSNQDGGTLTLTGSNFTGSHLRATGAFGFVLTPKGRESTVKTWITALVGRYTNQLYPGPVQGDLSQFDFHELRVDAPTESQMDGCRDWIAQAFTRFYLIGLVTMCGQELEETPALYNGRQVTYLNFSRAIPSRAHAIQPAPFWFPDIIDKKFTMTPTAEHPTGVTIQAIRMWRSKFHDRSVIRQETVNVYNNNRSEHFTFCYNYIDPSRPGSTGGASAGRPPSRGQGGSGPSSSPPSGAGGSAQTGKPNTGRPSGSQPTNTSAGGGKPGNGGAPSTGASTGNDGTPSWVVVNVKGEVKGVRNVNAKPDKDGCVIVYDQKSPGRIPKGRYHLQKKVYQA